MDNLNHCLLIASQDIMDGFFEKKVIYVLNHSDKEGALGFAVNHPIRSIKLRNLLEYLSFGGVSLENVIEAEDKMLDKELTLYQGGPADLERVFFLRPQLVMDASHPHQDQLLHPDRGAKLSLVDSVDELKIMLADSSAHNKLFVLGCAGWRPQQLEKEIELGFWYVAPSNERIIFGDLNEDIWAMALNSIDINSNDLVCGLGHA